MQINLLPWREQERHVQRVLFGAIMGGFVAAALFFVLVFHIYLEGVISFRTKRTDYLQQQLNETQADLVALEKRQEDEKLLLSQLQYIIDLRNKSLRAVHLLDSLATLVPSTLSLTKIIREGDGITLEGVAQSDIEITLFMKSLAKSPTFGEPVLSGISAQKMGDIIQRTFQLKVIQQG